MRYHRISPCPLCGGKMKAYRLAYLRRVFSVTFSCRRCGYFTSTEVVETDHSDNAARLQACIAKWNRVANEAHRSRFPLASRRRCRVCGCDDLHACRIRNGTCWWVEADLCSACHAARMIDLVLAEMQRMGRTVTRVAAPIAGGMAIQFGPLPDDDSEVSA